MRCPNCNCDVPEGSLFCPECGQKLEGVNGSQAENSGETYNDQQQDAEDVYGDQQRNKEDTYNDRSEDTEDSLWDQPQNSSDIYGTSPRNYGNPYGNQSQNQGGFYGNPSQNQNFGGSYGNQSQNFGGPYPGQQNGGNTYWRQPQSQNNGPERMAAGNHFDNSMQGGRKNKNPLIIIIAVVAIVASVGGAAFFALRSRAKDETIQKVADSSDYSIGNTDVSGSDVSEVGSAEEPTAVPEPTATPEPTSTPKPTPTPEAYPASAITASLVSESSVDFSNIHEAYIESASASSELKQASGVSNDPLLAFDNNTDTNWEEGIDGPGIGESITANFKYKNEKVRCIALKLGNWKSGKYYYGNNRPSKLTITLDDLSFQMDFPDSWEEFYVMLNHPFKASSIQIRIDGVHQGTSWDDTCITDVRVLVE
ncbi:zinc ribbon domain-containing protein [Ruminococcus sp. OF03-6AA]|jgi:flagellar basal body-associated protein FliL|nr:zinc ribbon domain-containing protein [Ruminococcus sp. OF03-6AA]